MLKKIPSRLNLGFRLARMFLNIASLTLKKTWLMLTCERKALKKQKASEEVAKEETVLFKGSNMKAFEGYASNAPTAIELTDAQKKALPKKNKGEKKKKKSKGKKK